MEREDGDARDCKVMGWSRGMEDGRIERGKPRPMLLCSVDSKDWKGAVKEEREEEDERNWRILRWNKGMEDGRERKKKAMVDSWFPWILMSGGREEGRKKI